MTSEETGRAGERAAVEYLRHSGFEICSLNWRIGHYELDIVARRDGVLHFVEVKTRKAEGLTTPEMAITQKKFKSLSRAAASYLTRMGEDCEVQFDLAAVDMMPDGAVCVRLIENAMEYNW